MKIALLGGTGDLGEGFALHWAEKHRIRIGSRESEKAEAAAERFNETLAIFERRGDISGFDNRTAAEDADMIILTIPYEHVSGVVDVVRPVLSDQIVVSPIVPMSRGEYFEYNAPARGSAAQEIQAMLPEGMNVVAAFHTVASRKLCSLDPAFKCDVMICGDDHRSKEAIIDLTDEIVCLRPLDVGPLALASTIESLTPLLLNIAALNHITDPSIKVL